MSPSVETEDRKPPVDAEEMVAADDSVIGRAVRWSLVLLAGAGAIAAVALFVARRPQPSAPMTEIEAEAPQPVVAASQPPIVRFIDVTRQAGIRFKRTTGGYGDKLLPETMGGGVAFLDYDNDGDEDLLLVNSARWPFAGPGTYPPGPEPASALYENDGHGRFTDRSLETGIAAATRSWYGMGVAAGDFDGDGWIDLFLTAVGPNRLLRNDHGVFRDVTARAGVAGLPGEWSTSAAFIDIDNDGDLDLFVANYVRWSKEIDFNVDFRLTGVGRAFGPPQNYQGTFPYLYRNEGNGRFTDISKQAGVQVTNDATGEPMAKALGLAPVDADGDGFIDLLVANDTVRKFFFHNRGDGTFEEVGEYYGIAYDNNGNATGAMGTDAGYLRDDGHLAFLISNFANEMTALYVAQDNPASYVDDAIGEGLGAPSRLALSFGLFLFDYDLDGRLDLLQANGHLEEAINQVDPSQHYRQPAQLYWNTGRTRGAALTQVTVSTAGDLGEPLVGRGATFADIDGDGDLDVIITQAADTPLLLRNDQETGHHWLRVKLVGTGLNRDAIGAWVTVKAGGATRRRLVMPTRSYLSQTELPVTFGLGDADRVEALTVTWPDGRTQDVEVGAVDRLLTVRQADAAGSTGP